MIDIEKLALLARIKLVPDEKERIQNEFEEILGYISKLQNLSRSAGEADIDEESVDKTAKISGVENITREDDDPHQVGAFSKDLLKVAPTNEKGYVKVKQILEQK